MRAHGARVGLGEVLAAQRALAAVDASDRAEVFYALRASLCSTRAELTAFAAAFTVVFGSDEPRDPLDDLGEIAKQALPRVAVPPAGDEAPAPTSARARRVERGGAAAREGLRGLHGRRAGGGAPAAGPDRAARARRAARAARFPTKRRRDEHDLRATVRASLRHGGELLERRYREPAERPRRLVLICDVSGSMAPYSRMLLQYMQACVAARARVEAFVFGTRLTRVTRELRGRDSDRALSRASAAVNDWSGGTRIGDAIAELNREHGRRIGRGSMVILLSDGWDRGEPEELAEEMARLARTAHRIVWLNPLGRRPALRAPDARDEGRDAVRRPAAAGELDRLARGAGGPDGAGHGVKAAGLILAAGAGTRFGDDQAARRPARPPAASYALDAMTTALDRVVVVLGHDAERSRRSRLRHRRGRHLRGLGARSGLLAAARGRGTRGGGGRRHHARRPAVHHAAGDHRRT